MKKNLFCWQTISKSTIIMISIIICSKNKFVFQAVSQQVALTIGLPHEIIPIDNANIRYSICEAYNLGASQSKYDYLCFMHEDIKFHSDNWGYEVVDALKDPTIGLIGIMGSIAKTKSPSGWSVDTNLALTRLNFIQRYPNGESRQSLINPEGQALAEVVTLDGCWLCTRKDVWLRLPFDQNTFRNFHFYDLDYALQVFTAGYKVCVLYGVSIEHLSLGNFDEKWITEALKFHEKWQKHLPVHLSSIRKNDLRETEFRTQKKFTQLLIKNKASKLLILTHLLRCLSFAQIDSEIWYLWSQFLTGKNINPFKSFSNKIKKNYINSLLTS